MASKRTHGKRQAGGLAVVYGLAPLTAARPEFKLCVCVCVCVLNALDTLTPSPVDVFVQRKEKKPIISCMADERQLSGDSRTEYYYAHRCVVASVSGENMRGE